MIIKFIKIKFERNKWIPYYLVSQSTVQLIRWGRNSYRYEPGKCNNLSHGNLMKIQSFIKKKKKTPLPYRVCIRTSCWKGDSVVKHLTGCINPYWHTSEGLCPPHPLHFKVAKKFKARRSIYDRLSLKFFWEHCKIMGTLPCYVTFHSLVLVTSFSIKKDYCFLLVLLIELMRYT